MRSNTRSFWWTQTVARAVCILATVGFLAHSAHAQEDGANPLQPANGDANNPNAAELAEAQTAFIGARLLCGPQDISPGCARASRGQVSYDRIEAGDWADDERRERYAFWQGDSLFVGVIDEEGRNNVDAMVEFYWFESSVERDADFYVAVLKVVSAPAPTTNWRIATPPSVADQVLLRDIGPAQRVRATMHTSGQFGAIRPDWSVPFLNYRWEPARVIEVEQEYTAGANAEGTAMKSITEGVNIQAKGFFNANAKVSTRYTITLWRWEMRVQPSPVSMSWHLTALDPEHERDPAYHEYFLVIQSPRGREARLEALDFGATFRERRGGLLDYVVPDRFHDVSVRIADIVLTPPQVSNCPDAFVETAEGCAPVCPEGTKATNGQCIPDCPDGFVARDTQCVRQCQEGYEARGNRCVAQCDERTERFHEGRCIPLCEDNERVEGNSCVPVCGEGQKLDGNRCVSACRDGEQFVNGDCEAICEDGERFEDGECIKGCPNGTEERGGECVRACPDGSHAEGDECVRDCGAGFKPAGGGRCVLDCPSGTEAVRGRCRPVENDPCQGPNADTPECRPLQQTQQSDSDIESKRRVSGDESSDQDDPDNMRAAAQGRCSAGTDGHPSSPWMLLGIALFILGMRQRRIR